MNLNNDRFPVDDEQPEPTPVMLLETPQVITEGALVHTTYGYGRIINIDTIDTGIGIDYNIRVELEYRGRGSVSRVEGSASELNLRVLQY